MKEIDCHEHVPAERAELFCCHDGGSTELEYLELLTALVRVHKPERILETGTWQGYGAAALARGCEANRLGEVISIDVDHGNVLKYRLSDRVTLVKADTLDWLKTTDLKFDLAFFDSDLKIRCEECRICVDRGLLKSGALAVFHDTSRHRVRNGAPDPERDIFWQQFCQLHQEGYLSEYSYLEFPLSRGLVVTKIHGVAVRK